MRGEAHAGLNMMLASPIVLLYPGPVHDVRLWIWLIVFIGVATFPDIDLRLELKHRGFTHTLIGALLAGLLGAAVYLGEPKWTVIGFAGGFTGALGHLLGDLLTHMRFAPLYPLSRREFALGLISTRDRRANLLIARAGAAIFTAALIIRTLPAP